MKNYTLQFIIRSSVVFSSILVLMVSLMAIAPSANALVPTVDCTPKKVTAYVEGVAKTINVVNFEGKDVSEAIVDPLYVMVMAAHADGVDLKIESGFRTHNKQKELYNCFINCNCNNCNEAAPPGFSNHQSGHAVDITTGCKKNTSNDACAAKSASFAWLINNAGYYGFEKTVKSEPWHWEWWEGGPGGGICFDSCSTGCLPISQASIDPMQKINEGWIGGPCKADAECGSPGGFCFEQKEDFAQGMCSEPCDKYCPDTPGAVMTFCVDKKELGVGSPDGTCVAKCSQAKSPTGCRPGYACKVLPRFNDPGTKASVCIPQEGGYKALSPKGWSLGSSTAACSFSRCQLEFGEVCSDGVTNGSGCVNAQCLDPATQLVNVGKSCSYVYSEHGTAVECNAGGELVAETTCSPDAPCNACGDCGTAPAEICDGIDNNCDGDIDEGLLNACGQCGEPPEEVCDGIDNNCDGDIDEGLLNACGQCGPAPEEVCDGADNDCDGDIDEGCPGDNSNQTFDIVSQSDNTNQDATGPYDPSIKDPITPEGQSTGEHSACQNAPGDRPLPLLILWSLIAVFASRRRERRVSNSSS